MPHNTERSGHTTLSGNSHRRLFRVALVGIATLIALVIAGGEALADPASPITVTKTASSNPVASGAQLTYTIVVKNTAGGSISNVVLSDQVNGLGVIQSPPALPQLILTSTKGTCSQGGANGNLVTCAVGTMAGGESFTVTIRGQVTAGAGTTLNNTASVTGTKSAQNFTTQSNAVAVLVTGGAGGQSDLTINKTGPTSVAPNGAMTYTPDGQQHRHRQRDGHQGRRHAPDRSWPCPVEPDHHHEPVHVLGDRNSSYRSHRHVRGGRGESRPERDDHDQCDGPWRGRLHHQHRCGRSR